MHKDKQRIAIGEALGWKRHADGIGWYLGSHPKIFSGKHLPDFCNDLNAAHEAESILIVKAVRGQEYICLLNNICGDDYGDYHATAAQRCEAMLKIINKWEESK